MGKAGNVFPGGHATHNGVNGSSGAMTSSSPPAQASRSPGNAFNFAKGPISPTNTTHSVSFKERLAAAQQHSSPPGKHSKQSIAAQPVNGDVHNQATPTEEQFKMDM